MKIMRIDELSPNFTSLPLWIKLGRWFVYGALIGAWITCRNPRIPRKIGGILWNFPHPFVHFMWFYILRHPLRFMDAEGRWCGNSSPRIDSWWRKSETLRSPPINYVPLIFGFRICSSTNGLVLGLGSMYLLLMKPRFQGPFGIFENYPRSLHLFYSSYVSLGGIALLRFDCTCFSDMSVIRAMIWSPCGLWVMSCPCGCITFWDWLGPFYPWFIGKQRTFHWLFSWLKSRCCPVIGCVSLDIPFHGTVDVLN